MPNDYPGWLGRDHGLPDYNQWRKYCNLSFAQTFDDLKSEIKSNRIRNKLKKLYGNPNNIDIWVGGVVENVLPGAKVGPTFRCLLIDQFRRLRDGDRFYFEVSSYSFVRLLLTVPTPNHLIFRTRESSRETS